MVSRATIAVVTLFLAAMPTVAGATGIVQTGDEIKFLSNASNVHAGPFTMRDLSNTMSVGNPGGVADFVTFCIEYNETIVIGQKFFAEIADSAAKGGRSVVDPFDPALNGIVGLDGKNVSDPLSVRTAFLYRQFVDGVLDGLGLYDPNNQFSRDGMQLAVWRLEGEVGVLNQPGHSNHNSYVLLDKSGSTLPGQLVPGAKKGNAEAWANNLWNYVNGATLGPLDSYDVKVMRMWSQRNQAGVFSGYSQDQLVSIRTATVPEPISTFSALLLGVAALGLARRRLTR